MIKHRKIILCILLGYALFIVGIFNVRADTYLSTVNVGSSPQQLVLDLTRPSSAILSNFTSFNSIDADYVVIPASLGIFGTDKTGNVGQPGQWSGEYQFLTMQPYLFGINGTDSVPCQLISNGFKCYLKHNSNYEDVGFFNNLGQNWNLYTEVWIAGSIDNNWQLYKDDNSQIANNTSDINNSLNDSSIDTNNTTSSTTSWGNKNASNGTVTNLLTLPISLLQAIVNGIQSSCTSFNLGSLFGTNIVLPCINIGSLIGSGLWSTIDILFSGFMILAIAKKLIKIFNDFTNLKTNQVDELYGGGK